jgi:hypothetical protein
MIGGFDAARALRAGLGDRRQAWAFIQDFAAAWTAPLGPGDGVSDDALRTAERRIGAGLPTALREAYLLFGRRADLTAVQDPLLPPGEAELSEVLVGRRQLGDTCELPANLITTVESAYGQLALAEYPSWYDRGITVRWFSAPGKLLRMDGGGPYCWLIAGGQTLADLESIRAAIPGPWSPVQWPGQEPR